MHTLLAAELPDIWERGESQHPIDRAITLLAAACPEKERLELVHMPIGQRDALLFALRKLLFGAEMRAYAECPSCGSQHEFKLNIEDLLGSFKTSESTEKLIKLDGYRIKYRLPDSADVAACVNSGSLDTDTELLERCVLRVTRNKKNVAFKDIPKATFSALVEMMEKSDSLADMQINLSCLECQHKWTMTLDILSFLWDELSIKAKQLLYQVHVLSRAYGWREADILAMSPWRRQYYLDMVI